MNLTRNEGRLAGVLYLLACLPGPFYLMYVPGRVLVPADAAATADRARALEWLLRAGIAGELMSAIFLVFAGLALYRMFRVVNEHHAQLMLGLLLVSVPISFLNVLNVVATLALARGALSLAAFPRPQLDSLASLFLRLHNQGFNVAQIFWGLWLFPYGLLVIRSKFVPRLFGVLLMVAGSGYVLGAAAALILPRYARVVSPFGMMLAVGEVPMLLWLLIRGRDGRTAPSSSHTRPLRSDAAATARWT